MRKKIFLVIVSMVACLLAACTATNSDANNSSMSQEASMSKEEALTEAELITDNNRGLIGTVITNTETAEAHSPDYNESNEQGEEATPTIPENTIITDVKENVLIPAAITVFIAEDNTTPEVIMPNGSCAVFAPSVGAKGWICQKGDVLHFAFEKYTLELSIMAQCLKGKLLMTCRVSMFILPTIKAVTQFTLFQRHQITCH